MRIWTVALLCLSCGGATPAAGPGPSRPAPEARAPAPPPAPTFRLDGKVVPKAYAVDLHIVPDADSFEGVVDIDVELLEAAGGLWLSGAELKIKEATLSAAGAAPFALTALPAPPGDDPLFVGFAFGKTVPAGPARLHIAYTGRLQPTETLGVFKEKDKDDWYVFTQFETADASRAFPCFDEPQWKTPWTLTLRVRAGDAAFANTPIVSEKTEDKAGGTEKAVTFATTKPLPAYLIAFAVGPFATVEARKTKSGTPIRIIVPKGREAEAAYAAESTPRLVEILEDYFGIPYPFEKLDSIALPHTIAFGAMENPGLITYNHRILLSRPEEDTLGRRQIYVSVGAHEIAHMWFGDLVTLAWWDDTWLNESFASWAGSMATARYAPSWGEDVERSASRSRVLEQDAAPTARPIRQRVDSIDDMVTAFDYTAYGKGEAVLEMFEAWLGPEVFRKGVNAYLAKYAYGTATANDFFAALGAASGRDVAPVLASFVDKPGLPLVTAELACPAGAAPRLTLKQERYHEVGAAAGEELWKIPVCARFEAGGEKGGACLVLATDHAEMELPATRCPDWITPNDGAAGYYRSALGVNLATRLEKVVRSKLSRAERVAYLGDVVALVRNGSLAAGDALALAARMDPATDWRLAEAVNELLATVRTLVLPAQRVRYGRYVAKLYGARAHALGLRIKPGEGDEALKLRGEIVARTAVDGRDAKLAAEARALAVRWLEDKKAIHPELVEDVLGIAAATADRALFDRLLAAAKKLPDPTDRDHVILALGRVRDPIFVREAFGLLLDKDVDVRQALNLLRGMRSTRDPEILDAADAFNHEHVDLLAERLPKPAHTALMFPGLGFCDEQRLATYQAEWKDLAAKMLNGKRTLETSVAEIRGCIALRTAQEVSLAKFLDAK